MEVILLKDVEKVGRKGEVIRVRDGFGRNFLIPRSLALVSTRANQEFVEEQKVRAEKKRSKEKSQAEALADKLKQTKIIIEAQSGEQDKLFGSVTAEDIREVLAKKGFAIDKKQIHLTESIRSLGAHTVSVELFPHVKAAVTIEVVRKS